MGPLGEARFASVAGALFGTRMLSIAENLEELAIVGKHILWNGAREVRFEIAGD